MRNQIKVALLGIHIQKSQGNTPIYFIFYFLKNLKLEFRS